MSAVPRVIDQSSEGLLGGDTLIDARKYGARGDGNTDDTNAINAALLAAAGLDRATVYFPSGTYLHSGITLSHSGVTLRGDGPQRSTLRLLAGSNRASIAGRSGLVGLSILQMTVDGNGANQESAPAPTFEASGIYFEYAQHIRIENVEVADTYSSGIMISHSSDVTIRSCILRRNGRPFVNANGIALLTPVEVTSSDSSTDIRILGNTVQANTGTGDGIFISSDVIRGVPQFNYRRVMVADNTVTNAFDEGIEVKGVRHFAVVGNRVSGSGLRADNRNGSDGILVRESSDGIVASNDVSGYHSGISLYTGRLADVRNVYVVYNNIQDIGKGDVTDSRGIKVLADRGYSISEVFLIHNDIETDTTHSMRPKAGIGIIAAGSIKHINIIDNKVSHGKFSGIYVENVPSGIVDDLTISRNSFTDNGETGSAFRSASGIQIDAGTNLLVEGNACSETRTGSRRTQYFGLVVTSRVRDVSVLANSCVGNLTRDIQLSDQPGPP